MPARVHSLWLRDGISSGTDSRAFRSPPWLPVERELREFLPETFTSLCSSLYSIVKAGNLRFSEMDEKVRSLLLILKGCLKRGGKGERKSSTDVMVHASAKPLGLPRPCVMPQFPQGLRFELSYPLSRQAECLRQLFERMLGRFSDTEPHPDQLFLPRGEG